MRFLRNTIKIFGVVDFLIVDSVGKKANTYRNRSLSP